MAQSIPGFNAQEVRDGIRLAMNIGLPPITNDQPLFVWDAPKETLSTEDEGGTPFVWDAPLPGPEVAPHAPVRVPCAIEYFDSAGELQPFGPMASSHLLLTLLDQEYVQIEGFSRVIIGGNSYEYERTAPPIGLDVVGVWQIHVRSDDEG